MSSSDSDMSLCSRILADEEGVTSRLSSPRIDNKHVADAVEGLLLLCGIDLMDSDYNSGEEEDENEEEEEEDEEELESEEDSSEEEVRPAGLEGRTWNWKKSLSVNRACESPPPSPENKHITKLQEEMDSLLHRRAVFQQELERVRKYQHDLKSFNKKLRKKLEEPDE